MSECPRVLVIDDERDMRTIIGLNLELAGMEYDEAVDGAEAVEMLKESHWDACILDAVRQAISEGGSHFDPDLARLAEEVFLRTPIEV